MRVVEVAYDHLDGDRFRHPVFPTVVGKRGQTLRYCLVDDAAGLVCLANLATVELHP